MSDKKKELLFSVTKKDLKIDYFRAGGKGGQKQNKTSSACRITHKESGAVGESRNYRSREQNKKTAFRRMIATAKFQNWVKIKASNAALQMEERVKCINTRVDKAMVEENLRIEYGEEF